MWCAVALTDEFMSPVLCVNALTRAFASSWNALAVAEVFTNLTPVIDDADTKEVTDVNLADKSSRADRTDGGALVRQALPRDR